MTGDTNVSTLHDCVALNVLLLLVKQVAELPEGSDICC